MRHDAIRIAVDIPDTIYRRLKEKADAGGCSVHHLILVGIKAVLLERRHPRTKRVRFPLIVSKGPKVKLASEQIYERVEFP
jgi:hypothetical protein